MQINPVDVKSCFSGENVGSEWCSGTRKRNCQTENEQLDIQAGDWVSGASQGFNNWLDDTKDISEQIKSTTTQMFDGMTDALGDFVDEQGKFSFFRYFRDFDLSRIALKASITGIFDSISNSSSGILGTIGECY